MERFAFVIVLLLVLVIAANEAFAEQESAKRAGGKKMEKAKQLEVGDMAPIFKLKSLDGKKEMELEKFRGKKPVVLLFGSYS